MKNPDAYTGIVYFHGIGTPRRHEELSRLVDSLDQYAQSQDYASVGRLRSQKVNRELSRIDSGEDFTYVSLTRIIKRSGRPERSGSYRVYESFWSPSAAGGLPSVQVLRWVFDMLLAPLRALRGSWRAHQPLKLSHLRRLYSQLRDRYSDARFRQLEDLYRLFENWPSRRRFSEGSFSEFEQHIRHSFASDTSGRNLDRVSREIISLARRWRSSFVTRQAMQFGASATLFGIGGSIALSLGSLAYSTYILVNSKTLNVNSLWSTASFQICLISAGAIFAILSRTFLKRFLSDVVFWTEGDEKSPNYLTRKEILRTSERTLLHLLSDPNCARIAVVGYSLGSAIAFDTLLSLGSKKKARFGENADHSLDRLDIISQFVTIGSPIDLINSHTELTFSKYHRYNRIAHDLRGSIDDYPFLRADLRAVIWTNISDPTDPISSRLFSPLGRFGGNSSGIREIVVRTSNLPNPTSAHADYFVSYEVLRHLFSACILGREASNADPASQVSETGRLAPFVILTAGTTAAWLIIVATLAAVAGWSAPLQVALAGGAVALVVGGAWAVGCDFYDAIHPLKISDPLSSIVDSAPTFEDD